jgi:basic membrane protein A
MGKCGGGERLEIYSTSPLKDWFAPDAAAASARYLVIRYNVNAQAVIQNNNEAWKIILRASEAEEAG